VFNLRTKNCRTHHRARRGHIGQRIASGWIWRPWTVKDYRFAAPRRANIPEQTDCVKPKRSTTAERATGSACAGRPGFAIAGRSRGPSGAAFSRPRPFSAQILLEFLGALYQNVIEVGEPFATRRVVPPAPGRPPVVYPAQAVPRQVLASALNEQVPPVTPDEHAHRVILNMPFEFFNVIRRLRLVNGQHEVPAAQRRAALARRVTYRSGSFVPGHGTAYGIPAASSRPKATFMFCTA